MLLNSLDPLRTLFIVQFIVQAVLLGTVVFLIVVDRKKSVPTDALDELKSVISKTSTLTADFQNQIKTEVDVVAKALAELDAKIREARRAAEALEKLSGAGAASVEKERKYTQADVIKLHRGGFSPVDISQITGIPVGEVQLMVKVNLEGGA